MSIYSQIRDGLWQATTDLYTTLAVAPVPEVIFGYGDGLEPTGSYVVVSILNIEQIGRAQQSTLTDEGTGDVKSVWTKGFYEAVVQFSFIGSEAGDLAQQFQHAVNNNRVGLIKWQENNLAPMRKSALRYNPQLRDTTWVDSFNMDVTFSYVLQTTQVMDWVEYVVIKDGINNSIIEIPPIP